jgi:methionine-rich copper-binding protein CopC
VVVGVIVGGAVLVGSAAPAAAHTALTASSPKDGGRIDVAPSEILLQFASPILTVGSLVVVLGPGSVAYQAGPAQIAGSELAQPLKPLGPAGDYRVGFRVVADDGHPLTGEIQFALTKPGPAAGGAKALSGPASLVPVSVSVRDAPLWESWTAGVLVVLFVLGAVLFGWRVTRDLDYS